MQLLCLTFLIISASCFYIDNSNLGPEKERIVGGRRAPINEAPYQAQLIQYGFGICGATIVSEYWLITAAHCFEEPYGLTVLTGSSFRSKGGQRHQIEKAVIHRGYNEITNDNDIALIKLTKPIRFNEYQKAIPLATKAPKIGDNVIISGYGKEGEYLRPSTVLKIATVPVVEQRNCALRYIHDPITSNMFCAGKGKVDACQGDSGGPAVINNELAGVVSSGMVCGSEYYPGIYTRVHRYYKWITRYTRIDKKQG